MIALFAILLCVTVSADNENSDPEQWYRKAYGPIFSDKPTERLDQILDHYEGAEDQISCGWYLAGLDGDQWRFTVYTEIDCALHGL